MTMLARLVAASLAALGIAASTGSAALAAGPTTATPTVTTVQTAAPQSDPTFRCAAGIVDTICQTVLGPICRNRCMSAPQAQAAPVSATRSAAATTTTPRASTGFAAAPASSPTITCATGFELLCAVLNLLFCRHGCG
jgi:hypothetical protein